MTAGRFTRRDFLAASLGAGLAASWPLSSLSAAGVTPRLVILGFDGVDPRLVERWIASGHLPNLARMRKKGTLCPLGTTSPPNSPVAWSSFATGSGPEKHGVFGFLRRDPQSYLPALAPITIVPPRFVSGGASPARAVSHRRGRAFWQTLDQRGVPVTLLFVPFAYPPPKLSHGRVLAGLGAPDLRFTNSSFTLYTSEPAEKMVAGGRVVQLAVEGGSIDTRLEGPRGPGGKPLSVPLELRLDRRAKTLTVGMSGKREKLRVGGRSGWFPVVFEAAGLVLRGRVRFHLLSVTRELKLYASPIQIDPHAPALPLGAPPGWLEKAVGVHGGLPTVGWAHDTSAVNAGALPKEVFLADLLDTMQGRAELLYREIGSRTAGLIVSVFTGTDQAAHIFYRDLERKDGGPLRKVYGLMDRIVGRVSRLLPPKTRLVVLSDHGFHPFDRMLHVNSWLESQGWFTRNRPQSEVRFLRGVSWKDSLAYSMGNGQVFVNLRGRESLGVVEPGGDRRKLLDDIRKRLLGLRDPVGGGRPLRAVYDVYDGAAANVRDRAPDLQLAFAPGYRSSWETSLGGAPLGDALVANPKAWCGDHAASDFNQTPGFIASAQALGHDDPHLVDLANSVLHIFDAPLSGSGRPLL
ncbi:MAG TPA: alkaline phosphatase family protein [Myxococcota bacterium]|nr:alkaline phosphatase family protein [Myxococcota bacterium]